jgi:tetratricopeptide (TPR) repeat protein
MKLITRFALPALALAAGLVSISATFGLAAAQNPPPAAAPQGPVCDVNETSPTELVRAILALQGAMSADTAGGARLRQVRSVIMNASANIEKGQNIPGRNYIMAKALFVVAGIKGFPVQTTRGELGFTTSPAIPVDLYVAMDSLFTSVEQSNPNCSDEIQQFYRFSPVWLALMQDASALLQAGQTDSAEKVVVRAQVLERKSPYTWQLLATIAMRRDDAEKAKEYWARTYAAAGNDTSTVDVKMQALYFQGELNLGQSTMKTGAEAVAHAREAEKYFRQFLTEAKNHRDAPAARANLGIALMAAGDTAAVPTIYADLIAKPAEYSVQDHLQAGVTATNARKPEDSAKLFGNAVAQAPYDRDALFNLCVSLFTAKLFREMIPPASKLVDVDPNNPDNLELLTYAYAMLESTETDTSRKRVLADSMQKYNKSYEAVKASHKVTFSAFTRGETASRLTGSVTNLGSTERTFRLTIDFLDKEYNVIGQGEASVGPVKPNESAPVNIEIERPGVVAWKARPIPPPM